MSTMSENIIPYASGTREKFQHIHRLVCETLLMSPEETLKDFDLLESTISNFPRYIPERMFIWLYTKLKDSDLDIDFCTPGNTSMIKDQKDQMAIEKIVVNNFVYGDLGSMKEIELDSGKYRKEDSFFYSLLCGEDYMRVNVLKPMFLSDQHLIAEYREVKMGPKALSKSLFSKGGVNKKRISKEYLLNTGHTYFFYDKNTYLEGRLARIVEEMALRGIEHNFVDLIDDKYDYHPDTFNDEWWNDWHPDEKALAINMERINQRFSIKPDGWYRFWSKPVLDTNDLISTRIANEFYECPKCRSIHTIDILSEKDPVCWNCCSKLPLDLEPKSYC